MKQSDGGPPNRELYALLHLSLDATDEEIRRAYRQWAQVYHPGKYRSPQMKEVATQNFQRICEAYEILSDEHKRQIYDIYGMEGLTSGLELGPKLSKADEIKEEIERLLRRKKEEKVAAHVRPSGTVVGNLSLPEFLEGESIVKGMGMSSELQSQLSKCNIQGNMAVNRNVGGGGATLMLKHQLSSFSSIEFIEPSIAVGWQKKDAKLSAAGEVKFGPSSFGASSQYTRRFSSKSHGRVAGKVGSHALEVEIGGGRKISEFSTVRLLYSVDIQGIFWKFELHRDGQKLIVPILLSTQFNPIFATGAFVIPTSLYFFLKNFVAKPYYLKREQREARENLERTAAQVKEARAAAERAQQLLENVANRKRKKQSETDGLVITKALYGNSKVLKRDGMREANNDAASQVLDVTLPLNFLVCDLGELKLHEGVKKSGILRSLPWGA